jgi:hypothetical protein
VVNICRKGSLIWFWIFAAWLMVSVLLVGIGCGVETVVLVEMVLVLVILFGGMYPSFAPMCYVNSWDWLVPVVERVR